MNDQNTSPSSEQDARTFGMIAHLSALAGFVIPFGHVGGPLIVWLMKREEHPFVEEHGREALNFQITVSLVYLVLIGITIISCGVAAIVTGPILLLLAIGAAVFSVMAGLAAQKGESYKYPATWRVIK